MIFQVEFHLTPRKRGIHIITGEVLKALPELPAQGILHLFIQHTSAALSINENADPDVRTDLNHILNKLIPENQPGLDHTLEGSDDMPAHAKCSLIGHSLTIPITNSKLNLGMWQGIYLCEFRNHGGSRRIIATIYH
jgi:secondary thiamine-phosphate synthase enzyme